MKNIDQFNNALATAIAAIDTARVAYRDTMQDVCELGGEAIATLGSEAIAPFVSAITDSQRVPNGDKRKVLVYTSTLILANTAYSMADKTINTLDDAKPITLRKRVTDRTAEGFVWWEQVKSSSDTAGLDINAMLSKMAKQLADPDKSKRRDPVGLRKTDAHRAAYAAVLADAWAQIESLNKCTQAEINASEKATVLKLAS